MPGHESYPPPGGSPVPPPGSPPPPYGGPPYPPPPPGGWAPVGPGGPVSPYPAWQPAPGMLGAAHKPGAIPLRPLGLGDLYDGAFKVIRYNPKATAGVAVLVTAVSALVTLLTVAGLLALGASFTQTSLFGDTDGSLGSAYGGPAQVVSTEILPLLLQSLGTLLVSGMVAHVVMAAAIGRRLSIEQAWAATRGKRWKLVGVTLLLGLLTTVVLVAYAAAWLVVVLVVDVLAVTVLFGLVGGLLFVAFMLWFWVRVFYLPVPALMLEDVGVVGAIGRGFRLTRGAFWRTFGIALLTLVVTSVAATVLAVPFMIVGEIVGSAVDGSGGVLGVQTITALSSVVAAAFVTPFTAAVTALQYVDLRMRKEAFDVELMTRAGITAS